jgi:hypothetical protein
VDTWCLTLREEHRLRVYENKLLRKILGPKKDEMLGGWRKLHNEQIRCLYHLPSITLSHEVKEDVLDRDAYMLLVRKVELKNYFEDLTVNGSLILKWI